MIGRQNSTFPFFTLGRIIWRKWRTLKRSQCWNVELQWVGQWWPNLMDNQWLLSWTCDRRDPIIILLRQYVSAKPSIMHGVINWNNISLQGQNLIKNHQKYFWIWAYCKTELDFKWKLNNVALGKSIYSFKLM